MDIGEFECRVDVELNGAVLADVNVLGELITPAEILVTHPVPVFMPLFPALDPVNRVHVLVGVRIVQGHRRTIGIVIVVVAEIGQITPPIGMNVFVLKSMLPDVTLGTIYKGIIPFFMADLVRLALIILFPFWTVLVLPDYMGRIQDRIAAIFSSLF